MGGVDLSRVTSPVLRVSDQVPHKPSCAATEDGLRLEISDLRSRGIVLFLSKNTYAVGARIRIALSR